MINSSVQHYSLLMLYVLFFEIVSINSRTSSLWKLNVDKNKIVKATSFQKVVSYLDGLNRVQFITKDDPMFNIITSTVHFGQSWVKERYEYYCTDCEQMNFFYTELNENSTQTVVKNLETKLEPDEILDCGKPVNFTYYDNLVGVSNRNKHPNVPEPQAALIFNKKSKKNYQDLDVDMLERRLKRAKREKPKSIQLYNQIGNFWRLKGDTEKSIECFRRALAVSPHNAEVLLNLARVLFTLQYLDDAIYLTRRSIEVQPSDKGAWQQYFTLGEILKAYGHYQEASVHLKHTLQLKPEFEPAVLALKEIESIPVASLHMYTLVIIICLVLGVLLVIVSSVDGTTESACLEIKTQRHFNKAMAMRSLKGLAISQKPTRLKKNNS